MIPYKAIKELVVILLQCAGLGKCACASGHVITTSLLSLFVSTPSAAPMIRRTRHVSTSVSLHAVSLDARYKMHPGLPLTSLYPYHMYIRPL